jgi:SAM-dependent methyltransferase
MRTPEQWIEVCRGITAGYTPGGRKEDTYSSGVILANILYGLGVWQPGDSIVDIGSGNGRLAMGLYGQDITYTGLEIIEPCVEFCQQAFEDVPNFRFIHVDFQNGHYWGKGAILPGQQQYPIPSAYADVVIAESVFSHTGTLAVARWLYGEMVRIVKPGGKLFSTWFFGEPDESERRTIYSREEVSDLFTGLISETQMAVGQVGILCKI